MKRRDFLRGARAALFAAGFALVGAAAAEAQDTIKFGAVAPKTGPLAGGAAVTHWPNLQLWMEDVNGRGGLKLNDGQHMIEIIEYDDKTNPGEHIKAAQRAATQDEVDFMLPPYSTGLNLAAAPIYDQYGYPQFAVTSVTDKMDELTERYGGMFFNLGTTTAIVEGLSDVLAKMRDDGVIGSRIAMVNVADAFGIELAEAARPIFEAAGFEIVYDKSYPLGTPDLSPVVTGAKESNPDAFVAWSYPPDTLGLTEQAIIQDFAPKAFYTAVATAFPLYIGKFGAKVEGVLGIGGVDADDEAMVEYRRRHKEVTGADADYWASANTYVALQVLEQAIEAVGELDRAKVTQYVKDNTFDTIMGEIDFDGQVSNKFWTAGQWQDGVFRGVAGIGVENAVAPKPKQGW